MALPTPTNLQTMDYAHKGQPFVNVPAKDAVDIKTMDYAYEAQPFVVNYNSGSIVPSEQTVTAKASITAGIQKKTQTLTAKGSFSKTFTQIIDSKGCLGIVSNQIISSKSRIQTLNIQSLTSKSNIRFVDVIQTLTAKGKIGAQIEEKTQTIAGLGRIQIFGIQTITAKGKIQIPTVQTISVKASIGIGFSQTIQTKAKIVCLTKPILVTPANFSVQTNPVYLVWEISSCCKNRNIHTHIEVDKTDDTFNDLEKDLYSFRDSGFEYWDGSQWQPYPVLGIPTIYYGNQARVQVILTIGDKWWSAKGGVK